MSAAQLVVGSTLVTCTGDKVAVMSIDPEHEPQTVYNLSLVDLHTFFVGRSGVWVHNVKDNQGEGGEEGEGGGGDVQAEALKPKPK